jgi:hypothetical protein
MRMRIRALDPGWEKIGTEIRDNPGSATLPLSLVWKAIKGTVAIVHICKDVCTVTTLCLDSLHCAAFFLTCWSEIINKYLILLSSHL